MPGEAKTSKFLLSDATIMVGPRADVFELTPAKHSIGLVKAVRAEVTHGWSELTQGVTNQTVYSVNNSIDSMISGEVYEYTARNLAYAAQIDATGTDYDEVSTILTLASEHDDTDTTLALGTGEGASTAVGDFLVLQQSESDVVAVVKVASIAVDTVTFDAAYGLPTGVTWAVATTRVFVVKKPVKIGGASGDTLYGVKIVGLLPENRRPVTLIFPKVRIMKGLSVAFDSQNFSNMPFEFKPYALTPADAFYADLPNNSQFMVLPA